MFREIETVRRLFGEYSEILSIGLRLQNYPGVLAGLPGEYAHPAASCIWRLRTENQACGACGGLQETAYFNKEKLCNL